MSMTLNVPGFAPACFPQAAREFAARGAAVIGPPALPPALHAALVNEAERQIVNASWSLMGTRVRGEIEQDSRRAYLGPVARDFLASDAVATLLQRTTGRALSPSWSATCYTHYQGAGQYMGEHCDNREACAIALLIYLRAIWPGDVPSDGLRLFVFRGDNSATPLASVITTHTNRCIVLNGAQQAHLRPALAAGESMLMLAGCFRAT
jgi:hypothetical protein